MQKYIEMFRPKKWLLNLLVLVPLFLSQNFLDRALLGRTLLGVSLFCVIASASYIVNDLFDRERNKKQADTAHPSGVPTGVAILFALVLGLGGLIGAFALNAEFGLLVLGYLVISLWLSAWLQNIALLDVSLRVALASLRVVAGALLIQGITPLFVVIVIVFGVAGVFFGKKLHAVRTGSPTTARYSRAFLSGVFPAMIALFLSSYVLFSLSAFTQDGSLSLKNNNLFFGDLFILFITLAFAQNVYEDEKKSPLTDPRIVIASLAYLIYTYFFLYVLRG